MMLETVILYLLTILVSLIFIPVNTSLNYFLVSVEDIITNNTLLNTIIFTFDATIDGTTPVTVTLSPNGMGEGSIGGGVVISGLMPDTLYTYTVSFVYNNIMYSTQSLARTSIGSTIISTSTMATTSSVAGMDNINTIHRI